MLPPAYTQVDINIFALYLHTQVKHYEHHAQQYTGIVPVQNRI